MNLPNYTTNGLAQFYADPRFSTIDGKNQTVVVIDTGVDLKNPHPLFGGDKNKNQIADKVEAVIDTSEWNPRNVRSLQDRNGHGTAVSSIILNIAKGANVIGAKSSVSSEIESIIDWSIKNKAKYGITAINLSQGLLNNTMEQYINPAQPERLYLYNKFKEATRAGLQVFVGAGNAYNFYKAPGLNQLAAYPYTFPVMNAVSDGVTYSAQDLRSTSQRRSDAIAAPGWLIPSVGLRGERRVFGGTSAATPFVTGSAVLLQGVAQKYLGRNLTYDEMSRLLRDTADPLGNTGYKQLDVYESAVKIYEMGNNQPITLIPTSTPTPTPMPTPAPISGPTPLPTPIVKPPEVVSITLDNLSRYSESLKHKSEKIEPNGSIEVESDSLLRFNQSRTGAKLLNPVNITKNTVLSFSFKADNKKIFGEVTGIGFDNDSLLDNSKGAHNGRAPFFSLESPNTGWNKTLIDNHRYQGSNTWQSFNIKVGDYFTGSFNYITFLNGIGQSEFKDIRVFESTTAI